MFTSLRSTHKYLFFCHLCCGPCNLVEINMRGYARSCLPGAMLVMLLKNRIWKIWGWLVLRWGCHRLCIFFLRMSHDAHPWLGVQCTFTHWGAPSWIPTSIQVYLLAHVMHWIALSLSPSLEVLSSNAWIWHIFLRSARGQCLKVAL